MKKIIVCLMATGLSLTFMPNQAKSTTNSSMVSTLGSDEAKRLVSRLEEIHSTVKSKKLDPGEKRLLRHEVLSISDRFKHSGPVIYISGGALILIIILLIILL